MPRFGYTVTATAGVSSVNGRTGDVTGLAESADAVPTTRTVSAGTGLSGGGDLSADRSLAVAYGTTAGTAAQGNDTRLSDQRAPTDGSVTDAKVASSAAIAESKLALASDAATGTASRRTLGTGATQAAAGNHAHAAYAPIDQPIFTTSVTLPGDPTSALGAATKQYVDKTSPLLGLDNRKLRLARNENVTAGATTEVVLANLTGPGCVEAVWMAIPGGAWALDGRLRVYYDGSSTASIDVDLGCLLVTHFTPNGAYGVRHLGVEIGTSGSAQDTDFNFRFPIPFGTSVKIAYYNSTGTSTFIFSQVTYRLTATDEAGGMRLRYTGARFADQSVSTTAASTRTLATITGGAGWLVYMSLVGGYLATNESWLERNIQISVDGEGTAAIISTGTEDFFDSGWYFGNRTAYTLNQTSMVGANKPSGNVNVVGMGTDLWEKWGGVPFTSSATVTHLTEAAVTTAHTSAWCILYYQ